ncbi:plasmid maintenance system antidote protein [Pedobacter sp. ISL-68]|uniref:helix-turn-helix transcriptional regulator n=1 Tax=unclassified Pedobacter TaxID=2628915 RepID=UPI001BED0BB3|nr:MULTISPECIES: plasmid maintenance system antidote protein [unclassified Pedobacter]MBT2562878.1 plasmid maintenance system antidote protein [Pedobacter sp. ISL-64]MBT2593391.1 plasmid maintenance system antidote protein [Pedobacter sp. ISL-68]
MEKLINKFKGIHPGFILERELKKRRLKKGPLALSLNEYPQTLNDITKGKRGVTASLSIKLDQILGLEEGTMLILQAYYEIQKEKDKQNAADKPDLSIIRKILFWDTDFDKINWKSQYKSVIQRVLERGNSDEKNELIRYYGQGLVNEVAINGIDQTGRDI